MKSFSIFFKSFFFLISNILITQINSNPLLAQTSLNYYFGKEISLDPEIPSPQEILGFQIGDRYVNHDQIIRYFHELADHSDKVNILQYGSTYERRPLLIAIISSENNIRNIEKIRQEHLQLSDPSQSANRNTDNMPVFIWLGYSVHGNEASGANASLLTAYYLTAGKDEELKEILDHTIILMDPCLNPDGFTRFSEWINTNRSENPVTDPNNRELNEPWPGGRTNHYWFDLNRDWLLLQHPGSKGRLMQFHQWKPNILTDHHETGSNETFFFQPGIPSRNNPITPAETFRLTEAIAMYHSRELDEIGSLYYSKESFDDYYYGKGSTYPDINGSVGILFEQASSRGYARETVNGILDFRFTVRNHFKTSISTIKAGYALRKELLNHQRNFYSSALEEADANSDKAWVFKFLPADHRINNFLEVLLAHQVEMHKFEGVVTYMGVSFSGNDSYIVRCKQPQYRLIRSIFEKNTQFNDSLFYDVSTWTIPLAYDIDYAPVSDRQYKTLVIGPRISNPAKKIFSFDKSDYGYIFPWNDYLAPKALYYLQSKGILAKVNLKSFTIHGNEIKPGGIFIPANLQTISHDSLYNLMQKTAQMINSEIIPVESSWTDEGIQLGSPNMVIVRKPEIALLIDEGIHSNEAGEVWHLFDQRYDIPVTLLSMKRVDNVDLNRYNTLIMVSGSYGEINENGLKNLKEWIEEGGNVVSIKNATRWLNNQKIIHVDFQTATPDSLLPKRAYGSLEKFTGAQNISGVILKTELDLTHPINFGLTDDSLPIFKNDKTILNISNNPYNRPVMITDQPLLSGYISDINLERVKDSPAMLVFNAGKGKIICFGFNPNFRAYWYGTNRLFVNAIYFGNIISSRATD